MIRIWLPADAHRRLLEGLPAWAPAHRALQEAPETHYAVGVRRVTCEMPEAQILLKIAERVYPESAQLIRMAIRKAGTTPSPRPRTHIEPLPAPRPRSHDHRPRRLSLAHSLASVHVLVFTFQALSVLDRARDVLRRFF
jgi:hypothetical protein